MRARVVSEAESPVGECGCGPMATAGSGCVGRCELARDDRKELIEPDLFAAIEATERAGVLADESSSITAGQTDE